MHGRAWLAAGLLIAFVFPTQAQHHGHYREMPYAGMDQRDLKAFSSEQVADLRAGRGMGLALPAELNGYPGPLHVLQLAEQIGLSPSQKARTEQLFESMKKEASAQGEELLRHEANLDRMFADQQATSDRLYRLTEQAALAQGRLRAVHLGYHLVMMELLTPAQVEAYARLRGYMKPTQPTQHP